jgi:hypothetical protein
MSRYRSWIIATGALGLLGSVIAEAAGWIPRSYAFESDALRMTIVAHAVQLRELPTLTGLTIGSLLMIIGPGIMMSRQQDLLGLAERKSALQAWHLKHLLPDEAYDPVRREL